MINLLLVIHIFVAVFLMVVILLQPGKGGAGGAFGGSANSVFGACGAGNLLTRTTSICAIIFGITSLSLSYLSSSTSVVKDDGTVQVEKASMTNKPGADKNADNAKEGQPAGTSPVANPAAAPAQDAAKPVEGAAAPAAGQPAPAAAPAADAKPGEAKPADAAKAPAAQPAAAPTAAPKPEGAAPAAAPAEKK